jgi:hypothetical protein
MKRNPTSEEKPDSDRYVKNAEDRFFFDRTCGIYKPKSCKAETKSSKETNKSHRFWVTTIISTLTLLAVGFYAYYAALQWCEMRRAADAAKKAADAADSAATTAAGTLAFAQQEFRQEQRPYIWATPGFSLSRPNGEQATRLVEYLQYRDTQQLAITFDLVNGGKSPAIGALTPRPILIIDESQRARDRAQRYQVGFGASIPQLMAPSIRFAVSTELGPIVTEGFIDELTRDKKRVYVVGAVRYKDMFASPPSPEYETGYCVRLMAVGFPFTQCDFTGHQYVK